MPGVTLIIESSSKAPSFHYPAVVLPSAPTILFLSSFNCGCPPIGSTGSSSTVTSGIYLLVTQGSNVHQLLLNGHLNKNDAMVYEGVGVLQ